LLVGENAGQGGELLKRGQKRSRSEGRARWLQVLAVRLGSFNPGPLTDGIYGAMHWACSRTGLLLAITFILLSALLAIGGAAELAARMPATSELATSKYLPAWIAAIMGVKVLHELGHAVACRHLGARPQEMGVLLLAGAPTLYCDVSDAWRLPSKWQRMAVSGAGMFVELNIAAAALVLWRFSEPGLLSAVCLMLIVVCSVGTLLVNANPLLRYDGYYMLADWLEVPNLAERGNGLFSSAWRGWLLGERRQDDDPLLGPHKRRAVWLYAILAKVYMALVLAGLFMVFLHLARPHHLENAVYTLAAVVMVGILSRPLTSAVKLAANPMVRSRFRWLRLFTAGFILGGVGVACLMIPITRRVKAPLVIVPADFHPVFAVTAGELSFVAPRGAEVKAGEVIARLHNPELELALREQEAAVRERRQRLAQLRTLQGALPSAGSMIPTAAAELADAESQLAEHRTMAESLILRAPTAGRVLDPPKRSLDGRDAGALREWSGSLLEDRNLGAWIEPGTPLAVIARDDAWVAWAGVEQADVTEVAVGQPVRLIADQSPTTIIEGRVREVARRARTNEGGVQRSRQTDRGLDNGWYHVVQIELSEPEAPLLAGARGTAKIATYHSTVGELVLNQLRRTFQRVF
jgi:putative peptide zinc metalloprotease protein